MKKNKFKVKFSTVDSVGWSDYDKRQRNSEADKKKMVKGNFHCRQCRQRNSKALEKRWKGKFSTVDKKNSDVDKKKAEREFSTVDSVGWSDKNVFPSLPLGGPWSNNQRCIFYKSILKEQGFVKICYFISSEKIGLGSNVYFLQIILKRYKDSEKFRIFVCSY